LVLSAFSLALAALLVVLASLVIGASISSSLRALPISCGRSACGGGCSRAVSALASSVGTTTGSTVGTTALIASGGSISFGFLLGLALLLVKGLLSRHIKYA
jgi:hypothetical protein